MLRLFKRACAAVLTAGDFEVGRGARPESDDVRRNKQKRWNDRPFVRSLMDDFVACLDLKDLFCYRN